MQWCDGAINKIALPKFLLCRDIVIQLQKIDLTFRSHHEVAFLKQKELALLLAKIIYP
jgi:hypothetical protein